MISDEETKKEYILLYYRSNYKWFLKKVVESYSSDGFAGFNWSFINNYRLFVIYKSGDFEVFDMELDFTISSRNNCQ
jgi:hypothetical protein